MKLDKRKGSLIGFVFIVLSFLIIMLFKTHGVSASQKTLQETIVPSLIQLEQENQQVSGDNEKLQLELEKYAQGHSVLTLDYQQLQETKMKAGLIEVAGPGLRITLDDWRAKRLGKRIRCCV